jgi:hypothetical protein
LLWAFSSFSASWVQLSSFLSMIKFGETALDLFVQSQPWRINLASSGMPATFICFDQLNWHRFIPEVLLPF